MPAGASRNERDNESRVCLMRLGVEEEQIIFLGTESRIPDGHLVNHLEQCFWSLVEKTKNHAFAEIYTPAWEGGHQDHDAAFLIGLALARRLGLENNLCSSTSTMALRPAAVFFVSFIRSQTPANAGSGSSNYLQEFRH
jgi:LmbE family N-acetylglucosaminyl deacetylase